MNNWTYVPGTTYTINFTVRKPGGPVFGMGLEILKSNGDNAGTLIITNTARTWIKSRLIGSYSRRSVVHTLNGGLMYDSCVFSFNWTAPTTNIGNVTLYAAGNAGNHSNTAAGDYIYTLNQVIVPDNSTGFNDELQTSASVNVFPNPAREYVNLRFHQAEAAQLTITLADLKGSATTELLNEYVATGDFDRRLNLPDVAPGIYLLYIRSGENTRSKRIVIR
jgi:hypothetical protein